jgi:hypothetical protein
MAYNLLITFTLGHEGSEYGQKEKVQILFSGTEYPFVSHLVGVV